MPTTGALARGPALLRASIACAAGALALPVGAGGAAAQPTPAAPAAAPETAAAAFSPLDLPDWVLREPGAAQARPWILVIDDPQCPYCMQLHLALEKRREQGDPEITQAVLARLPFPLPFHDQSAHVVEDAFCLEAGSAGGGAAAYLDWLMVEPWKAEPGWKDASVADLEKDGGLFDTRYESHKVSSSRRRDYQTERARGEAGCAADGCRGDAACETLCATQQACRQACPPAPAPAQAGAAPASEKCLSACTEKFVSARYRQLSQVHWACLREEGPASAHGRTAAAFAWAMAHDVPGTPTVYVGHPRVGFRQLRDADDLASLLKLLVQGLAEARAQLAPAAARR